MTSNRPGLPEHVILTIFLLGPVKIELRALRSSQCATE